MEFGRTRWAAILGVALALCLIASFLAHALIEHRHNEAIFGGGLDAAFHGLIRESVPLLPSLALLALLGSLYAASAGSREMRLRLIVAKLHDPIRDSLRTGLLNPRPH